MDPAERKALPIVYACSGCSSAAQLANHVAVRLDRTGIAEMSCIAGVGGDVPSLIKTAQSGRAIVVLDGCPLECARHCLQRHGVTILPGVTVGNGAAIGAGAVVSKDVGGTRSRRIHYQPSTGRAWVQHVQSTSRDPEHEQEVAYLNRLKTQPVACDVEIW